MPHHFSPGSTPLGDRTTGPAHSWAVTFATLSTMALLLIAPGCLSSSNPSASTPTGIASSQSTETSSSTRGQTTSTSGASAPATAAMPINLTSIKVSLEPVFTGLDQPLYLTHSGDGSGDIFIVEKGGTIRIVKNGQVQNRPFLDITTRVGSSGSEQGLLSVAFHPDYKNNGFLFVDYTDTSGNTVVARFTAASDRNSADSNSFKKILGFQQPFQNHNGGQLAFGPDGMLWIGAGDGGSAGDPQGNGQNTNTLLGSILRIDVDHGDPYAIPADNPFANGSGGKPEVWAFGLRNPWRFSFDRLTHDLYIGDVGQSTWEEIDFVSSALQPGLNFGWNRMEGTHCYPPNSSCDKTGITFPVAEYSHAPGNCSVTGGYVYRGAQYPEIDGVYFFTDYCSGAIWALADDASGNWTQNQVGQGKAGYSSFGEDGNGELYVTDLSNGTVYHLTASSK